MPQRRQRKNKTGQASQAKSSRRRQAPKEGKQERRLQRLEADLRLAKHGAGLSKDDAKLARILVEPDQVSLGDCAGLAVPDTLSFPQVMLAKFGQETVPIGTNTFGIVGPSSGPICWKIRVGTAAMAANELVMLCPSDPLGCWDSTLFTEGDPLNDLTTRIPVCPPGSGYMLSSDNALPTGSFVSFSGTSIYFPIRMPDGLIGFVRHAFSGAIDVFLAGHLTVTRTTRDPLATLGLTFEDLTNAALTSFVIFAGSLGSEAALAYTRSGKKVLPFVDNARVGLSWATTEPAPVVNAVTIGGTGHQFPIETFAGASYTAVNVEDLKQDAQSSYTFSVANSESGFNACTRLVAIPDAQMELADFNLLNSASSSADYSALVRGGGRHYGECCQATLFEITTGGASVTCTLETTSVSRYQVHPRSGFEVVEPHLSPEFVSIVQKMSTWATVTSYHSFIKDLKRRIGHFGRKATKMVKDEVHSTLRTLGSQVSREAAAEMAALLGVVAAV